MSNLPLRHSRWLVAWVLAGSSASAWCASAPEIELDFEGDSGIVDKLGSQAANFSGAAGNGSSARKSGGSLAQPEIQYEGGSPTQRGARLSRDPASPSNHVLEFWVTDANVGSSDKGGRKSRVQMNLYGNRDVAVIYQSSRLYLYPEMAALRDFPRAFSWLTLSEWWNDAAWTGEPHPFRITVNLQKPGDEVGSALFFGVDAQAMAAGETKFRGGIVWQSHDRSFPVPVGKWIRLEYFYRQGNAGHGRFAMAVTPDGGARQVLFEVTGFTHHPAATRPDGLRHFNPVKLYTSAPLTDFLKARGQGLRLAIDDLRIWACQSHGVDEPTPCERLWSER